jgi:hypothetical protein
LTTTGARPVRAGKELRHPPLLLGRTADKKIFHEVGALPCDERTTAAETSYIAISGSQISFYFDYAILGAALRTLERCGGGREHVSIMRQDFAGG